MKQEWIEDFLALVESGSFSRAAAERCVTQPAFSRRIQALENWLGVQLVDRSRHPVTLTTVARRYEAEFRTLLRDMVRLRARMRVEQQAVASLVLTTQHSLTITRLPALLQRISTNMQAKVEFSVRSENRDECVALFMRGEADMLLCLEEGHDSLLSLVPDVLRVFLGNEDLVPVSAPDQAGRPLFGHPDREHIKVLAVPAQSHMGRLLEPAMRQVLKACTMEIVHESVFLAGVKEMARIGMGMAWLPASLVATDLANGALLDLSPRFLRIPLQLGLYGHRHGPNARVVQEICAALNAGFDSQESSLTESPGVSISQGGVNTSPDGVSISQDSSDHHV